MSQPAITQQLRQAVQQLGEASRCEHCQGMRLVLAHEAPHPTIHCTCPGGPLWSTLLTNAVGATLKLAEAQRKYAGLVGPGKIPYFNFAVAQWASAPAPLFREAMIEFYRRMNEHEEAI